MTSHASNLQPREDGDPVILDSPLDLARPKVLLTDTDRRPYAARLALVLSEAGCDVSAICSAYGHPLLETDVVRRTFAYTALRPMQALVGAIEAVDPDFIVPCDDRAVEHLHGLHARTAGGQGTRRKIADLIERSLGSPESYPTVSRRYELLKIAQEEGLRVPQTELIASSEDIQALRSRQEFPCVLKADESWGGRGVRILHNADDLETQFRDISRPFRLPRAIKRMAVNRDPFWLRPWWEGHKPAVIVQGFVKGRAANCAVFCWRGRVLAGIGVEVVSSDGPTGPATIVRVVDNPEMMRSAERLAQRLQISGFFGLDFVIEDSTDNAYLIEMNPRTTPLCHLQLGAGRDMITALWSQLSGQPTHESRCVTEKEMIAYYPQALSSPRELLETSYLDAPIGSARFLEEFLNPWPARSRLYRLASYWDRMTYSKSTPEE